MYTTFTNEFKPFHILSTSLTKKTSIHYSVKSKYDHDYISDQISQIVTNLDALTK